MRISDWSSDVCSSDLLDRYDGFAGYAASKARLFAMQSPDHAAILGIGDAPSAAIARSLSARGEHLSKIAPGVCLDQSVIALWLGHESVETTRSEEHTSEI